MSQEINKICPNCKHCDKRTWIGDICKLGEGLDTLGASYQPCVTMRMEKYKCGPDGKLFEQKFSVISWIKAKLYH